MYPVSVDLTMWWKIRICHKGEVDDANLLLLLLQEKTWKHKLHFHVFIWDHSKRKNSKQHKRNFTFAIYRMKQRILKNFFPQICSKDVSGNLTFNRWLSTSSTLLFLLSSEFTCQTGKVISITLWTGHPLPYCIFSGSTLSWAVMEAYYSWGGRRTCSNWNKTLS